MTVAECARDAAATLIGAGFAQDDARRDAGVLARHVLGWDTAAWLVHGREEAAPSLPATLDSLIRRRARGEPVAYLVGTKEFWGRPFIVSPEVLIPRPETEGLVERVLRWVADRPAGDAPLIVVDVGTGSGCIAVTLAAECPALRVIATDTSVGALAVAASNAHRHAVADRISFTHACLMADATTVDLVVSNPPYVADRDRPGLMRDVRDFEPAAALFGGADGLDVIRALIPVAFRRLREGGALMMEVGSGQAADVAALFSRAGLTAVSATNDLAGVARVVEGLRPRGFV